jgi:subtilisin family serine protease
MVRSVKNLAILTILVGLTQVPPSLSTAAAQDAQTPAAPRLEKTADLETNNVYIVQMSDPAVVAYTGDVPGLRGTKPASGQKIDPDSAEVRAYSAYLESRQDQALATVGVRSKLHVYRHTFSGFAAEMTADQAEALRTAPGVVNVTKDEQRYGTTSTTPHFLGLDDPDSGLWKKLGGVETAGENIVIGVIDSGVWPEGLSFSDRGRKGRGKRTYSPLLDWHGGCRLGEWWGKADCNLKLIGAQYYNAGWGGDAGLKAARPWEFTSARDYNGHGTHTASTAGGNHGVQVTGPAAGLGAISGMAPRARIAVYKALWATSDGRATGFTSDLVAAIDQAVADGVDVINFSISGTSTEFLDPVQVSFLFAADAGIFVAASAGNDGPVASTVAHPGPWLTTVAAGTHDRNGEGAVELGNGTTYTGPSLAVAVGPAPLVDSVNAGLPGADAVALSLCYAAVDNGGTPVLDPAKVAGKIVVCDRGVNARVNKSRAVLEAGGVGMILLNTSPSSLNADVHLVPTVHLPETDRPAIKAYAATGNGTATIKQATITFTVPAPLTAVFSSRGPLLAGGGDLLKPDLIAPGQDILAAVAPPGNGDQSFALYSGTSMSSPHVAGLAALLKNLHQDWSPMMIKSALMTTGYDLLDGVGTSPAAIFRQGAGHVTPNKAADPGLLFDSSFNDWLAFLCGTTSGVNPANCGALESAGYSLDPSDLNTASIAIGNLAGVQTITRTVINPTSRRSTYTASYTGLDGIEVSIDPPSLTVGPGKAKSFTVTFTTRTAPANTYAGGQLLWSDGTHDVRIPMVVRPVALAAPAEVTSSGGPIAYTVGFGYDGPFAAAPRGLVPAVTEPGDIVDDPTDTFSPTGPGTTSFTVSIPAGTTYARFSLYDSNVTLPADLDLYVYRGTTLVGNSGSGTSEEEVNLVNPVAGLYTVYVHGFAVPDGGVSFTLFDWLLPDADAGNMTVTAPATAAVGATGAITLAFDAGLAPGSYLGSIVYSGAIGLPAPTIVRLDKP